MQLFPCSKNNVISGLQSQRPKLQYRYLGRKARSTFRYGEAAMEGLLQRVIYSPETKEQKKKHQKMQLSSLKKKRSVFCLPRKAFLK